MTHTKMIIEMAKMQEKLDVALLEKGKALGLIEGFDRNRCIFALIDELGELTHALEFTMEDVYQGYIKKNKENYERIANGY